MTPANIIHQFNVSYLSHTGRPKRIYIHICTGFSHSQSHRTRNVTIYPFKRTITRQHKASRTKSPSPPQQSLRKPRTRALLDTTNRFNRPLLVCMNLRDLNHLARIFFHGDDRARECGSRLKMMRFTCMR